MTPPRRTVNRRDLLRLRTRPGAPGGASTVNPTREAGTTDLLRARRPGMGSFFEVRLPAHAPGAVPLATRALDRIGELESQLTVYRDDSEVSRLNASAHLGPVEVEPGLFRLLEVARDLHAATGGAYDVTAGALSVAWGFFKGPKRVPDPATRADARDRTGQHHLTLDPGRRTVAFDRPGIVINLGSIGKGYALDRAARLIRDHWWPTPALLHGGQSSVYALGSPPGSFLGRWSVDLHNPADPSTPLGSIYLRDRGLATSGAAFQRFEVDGVEYGHILDPRTGGPAHGPLSVTALAPTAAEADALSTAFYLLGPDGAAEYIIRRPGVGALFVMPGRAAGDPPVVRSVGLAEGEFVPAPADTHWIFQI